MPFRIAVLASGTGTNLQAILDTLHGREGIEVVAVASNRPDATALERARGAEIETAVFPTAEHPDREARDREMAEWLSVRDVDLIALAGYMEILSVEFVRRFAGHLVNIHPSLLPSFPGLRAIERTLESGARVGGVTVHFVDEGVDSGPIIAQRAVEVPADRDLEEFERRIHAVEHELYPEVIRLIAAGAVSVDAADPRVVHVDEALANRG